MGKSRVARQTADACADEFEGASGGSRSTRPAPATRCSPHRRGLRLPLQPALPLRDQVHGFLRDRPRLLLVLDNTEQVEEAATVVRDLLAQAPGLSCLVTSRRALGLRAETLVEIRPLPPLDAQRLFADRARAAATTSVSRTRTPTMWPNCAAGWRACRSPSSWPPRASPA
jgi:predicted ATPase